MAVALAAQLFSGELHRISSIRISTFSCKSESILTHIYKALIMVSYGHNVYKNEKNKWHKSVGNQHGAYGLSKMKKNNEIKGDFQD